MKKIGAIFFVLFCAHNLLAYTVGGDLARQLYNLISAPSARLGPNLEMEFKTAGPDLHCSRIPAMMAQVQEDYIYKCNLPRKNLLNQIWLGEDSSKVIFNALMGAEAQSNEFGATSCTQNAISCTKIHRQFGVSHGCVIRI